jgi:hypothetical protein
MGGACSAHRGDEKYNVLVGKPQGRRPLGKLRRRWKDTFKIDLREMGMEGMD